MIALYVIAAIVALLAFVFTIAEVGERWYNDVIAPAMVQYAGYCKLCLQESPAMGFRWNVVWGLLRLWMFASGLTVQDFVERLNYGARQAAPEVRDYLRQFQHRTDRCPYEAEADGDLPGEACSNPSCECSRIAASPPDAQ